MLSKRISYEQLSFQFETLYSELEWVKSINSISNALFPVSCKVTLIGLRWEIEHVKLFSKMDVREDGLWPIYRPNLEKRTGLTVQSISDNLSLMVSARIIMRKLEHSDNGNKRMFLGIADSTLRMPASVRLEKETGKGGKRTAKPKSPPMCSTCGSYDVDVNKNIICRVCSVVDEIARKSYYESDNNSLAIPHNASDYPPTFTELHLLASDSVQTDEQPHEHTGNLIQLEANNWQEWNDHLKGERDV